MYLLSVISNERCSVMELDKESTSLDLSPAIVSSLLSVSCVKLLIHLLIVRIVHPKMPVCVFHFSVDHLGW